MLLNSINLNNIRSFQEQTIHFQEGITLLAGDIGSGKSTILHAIEFALFGAARPDLPADSLLRKGATKASVTLNFNINNHPITIYRTLQQTKQGVRQGTGYIIQNNQKYELTAVELKAKMIEILAYPKELISKGKNYVYRYTIYCPQEEMKQILQESDDNRLDILRKIFQVERYKLVRDNIILYLKTLRKEITVLTTRSEPLPQKEKELLVAQDALSTSQREQQELIKIKQELQLVFEKQQKLVDQIKKSNQTRQKLQHEKIVIQRSQTDLAEQQTRLAEKIKQVDSKRKALLIDDSYSIEMINQEADSVHSQLDQITVEKHHFESTSAQLQSQIKELQVEITKSKESQNKLSAINDQIKANKPVLATQESLEKEKENLDQETNSIQLKKATCQNQLYDLTQKKQKIEFLTKCPTCEQSVPEDHCNKIKQQISEDTQKLQQTKDQLINQEQAAQVSIKSVLTRLRELKQIQETQNKLLQEQASLKAFVSHHEQSNSKLKEKVIENNSLMDKFQEFLSLKLPLREDLQKRIASLQNRKEQTLLAVQLKNQVSELTIEQSTLNQKFSGQLITLKNIETNLQTLPDDAKRLLEFENSLELARNNLESKKIGLSKQDQIVLHQKQILDNLQVELQQLRKIKTNLLKTKELARWIDGKFIPLTQHIEREIMLKIYHYCNELFSEWFEILTEGSELSASLDSGFAPIIEQQGHEIAFAYLSGGERTAASLAYRLALTKAINHVMQQINTKELLILDEPTDGFSAEQLQRLRDCLETIGLKQILIVSHEAMMEGFVNHILNVEKRSGVSSVH